MKLYYAPGACSLAPHIVLLECDATFQIELVDLRAKQTESGQDYLRINPKGYVPALAIDEDFVLTEASVIMQYIADQFPNSAMIPAPNTKARYQLLEWVNYITSEIHKGLGPLFREGLSEEMKLFFKQNVDKRLGFAANHLNDSTYLMDDTFTIADAYLFTVLRWTHYLGVSLEAHPSLTAYMARIKDRPSVKAALQAEGLKR